ncbi:hypothetical protein [Halomicrococcus sp. NG-SE-24]|uniref:hypothetical protein n=1 Tax=Halomicrococcus sp. NG-SE-24 TaxID=3436928 RepID=UPI003D96D9F3
MPVAARPTETDRLAAVSKREVVGERERPVVSQVPRSRWRGRECDSAPRASLASAREIRGGFAVRERPPGEVHLARKGDDDELTGVPGRDRIRIDGDDLRGRWRRHAGSHADGEGHREADGDDETDGRGETGHGPEWSRPPV